MTQDNKTSLGDQKMRIENDSLGSVEVPYDAYWGSQTQRAVKHFSIGYLKMPKDVIHAIVRIKKAAALVNMSLKLLDAEIGNAIVKACDRVLNGEFSCQFPVPLWSSGSGTQCNMNVNEVIACIANEMITGERNNKKPVHPNDHVNMSQSSNDVFPTAMHIAIATMTREKLITGLQYTCDILRKKTEHFWEIIKIGRTHMQDAVPLTLGQEFSAYLEPLQKSLRRIKRDFGVDVEIDLSAKISDDMINNIIEKWRSEDALGICALAQGGTAVGSGLNTHPEFAHKIAIELTRLTGLPFYSAENKFSEIANIDSILAFSGELNNLATNVMKIANDIRLLASGPRCGIGELQLPENEPGSSIMPGKVNPSQCESITMICAQVMGNHFSTTICGTYGPLELNVFRTCVIHNMLESIEILGEGLRNFTIECLEGIEPNHKRIEYLLENSLMLVTCLNSKIGYDNAAKIARHAFLNDMSLKDAAITLELLSEVEFDDLVDPKKMIRLDEGRKTLTND